MCGAHTPLYIHPFSPLYLPNPPCTFLSDLDNCTGGAGGAAGLNAFINCSTNGITVRSSGLNTST